MTILEGNILWNYRVVIKKVPIVKQTANKDGG